MLPLRDENPSEVTPWVVYGLIAVNVAVFLFEITLPRDSLAQFLFRFGFVPRDATLALKGEANPVTALLLPLFTSMFLHGGLLHVAGNMWFLFIFGDNVEARLGHLRFIGFYLLAGVAAAGAQYALAPGADKPLVGASGAIAGALGAYIAWWPRARIVTLVPLFMFITFVRLPALLVLGFWFMLQVMRGLATVGAAAGGGVAYGAHAGGFIVGLLVAKLLPRRKRSGRARSRRSRW